MDAERSTYRRPEDGDAIAARARAALDRMDEALAALRRQPARDGTALRPAGPSAGMPADERR